MPHISGFSGKVVEIDRRKPRQCQKLGNLAKSTRPDRSATRRLAPGEPVAQPVAQPIAQPMAERLFAQPFAIFVAFAAGRFEVKN